VLNALFAESASANEGAHSGPADSTTVNCGTGSCSIKQCIKLLESIEELSKEEKSSASILMKCQATREVFMSFEDTEVRLGWIKKELEVSLLYCP